MSEPQRVGETTVFQQLAATINDHGVAQCPHCGQPHNVWGCSSTTAAWPSRCVCCHSIMKAVEVA